MAEEKEVIQEDLGSNPSFTTSLPCDHDEVTYTVGTTTPLLQMTKIRVATKRAGMKVQLSEVCKGLGTEPGME